MIEDIMAPEKVFKKDDLEVREMSMRTNPTDDSSPLIKRKFIPLDNPATILEVLKATLNIKAGVRGNNVTTGPNQYAYWRACLGGEALRKFNEFSTTVGTETTGNLVLVEQRLVREFAPRDVLTRQARYMRYDMRKPSGETTRKYVGAVGTLNETLKELPPLYDASQKIADQELLDILASKAPTSHKAMMIEHGFDPQSATLQEFVEFSERAETKQALQHHYDKDASESDNSYKKVARKGKSSKSKHNSYKSREDTHKGKSRSAKELEFYCSYHKANDSHDTVKCKVLNGEKDYKKKTSFADDKNKRDKRDSEKAKYKAKSRDLHLLQIKLEEQKARFKKLNIRLQARADAEEKSEASEASSNESEEDPKQRTFKPKEELFSSSAESEHASGTESTDSEE
jgi:hypothetical protein